MTLVAGSEFTVNTSASDAGFEVSVAGHNDGTFLVSWVSLTEPVGEDGDSRHSYDILARSFSSGKAISGDVIVNAEQRDGQFNPQAAARSDGSYVVAYSSGEENHLEGTFAASQVISNSGMRIGEEQFGEYSYYHAFPDVAVLQSGGYVVVSSQEDAGEAQVHTADGRITAIFEFGGIDARHLGVSSTGGEGYLLLWHGYASREQDDEGNPVSVNGLYGKTQTGGGVAGTPFLISTTGDTDIDPTATLLQNGKNVVLWSDGGGIKFAIVEPTTGAVSAMTNVTSNGANQGELAVLGNGDFVVAWTDYNSADGSGTAIAARVFHADGTAASDSFVVNERTSGDQQSPSVAAIGGGGFVIGWEGPDGIEARTFTDTDGSSTSPLFTRAGTIDLSSLQNQAVAGSVAANSFYVDTASASGHDRIYNFGSADVLLTTAALYDGNRDGIVSFGKNGILDLDGPGGTSDSIVFSGGTKSLRSLGESGGLHVYASGDTRPAHAIEGTLGSETLHGDVAGSRAETFFYDTALGVALGTDRIDSFGTNDILVTTAPISDANGDGVINFGRGNVLDIIGTHISMHSTNGSTIGSLEFDGQVEHGGSTYYVYSTLGSAAGVANLHL